MAAKVGENTSKLGKIGQYAKEGAVTGALIAGAETPAKAYVNPEQTVGDHLKRIGVETAAGAAITPLAHGLMNAVQNLRKTKGILLLLTYRMMSFSRKDNKGIHQSSCGRTSITRYTYQKRTGIFTNSSCIRIRTIVRTSNRKCGQTEKESFFKWRTS